MVRLSRLHWCLGLALVCLGLPQAVVAADGVWSRSDGWQVSWHDDRSGCTATNLSKNREALYLTVSEKGSQLLFFNPDWSFVRTGEQYKLGLLFDARHYWGGVSVGLKAGGVSGLRARVSRDLLEDFAKKRRVRLFVDGNKKPVASFSLTGSFRALKETIACANARERGGLRSL